MAKKPNVVLILVDNQPAKMMGCSGNDEIHTPHLDRLAARGVRFDNAYCPNAMCSPCRASVLTGLMPSQHGVHTWLDDYKMDEWPENWNALSGLPVLPQLLKDSGYATALIGKYHLGAATEPQNGFDKWVTFRHGHVTDFTGNEMIEDGKTLQDPGHCVDFFTDRAESYLKERAQSPEDPFFLYLSYPAPYGHWPAIKGEPQNRFAHLYKDTRFDSVPREGLSQAVIDWMLIRNKRLPGEEDGFYQSLARLPNDLPTLRNYYSQMSLLDDGVGRIMTALEDNGQVEDTLVIYTSDHGMSLGENGFWGHGEDTWPANTHRVANHIPFIMKPAGPAREGRVVSNLVGSTSIFPTVLEAAGTPLPQDNPLPGRSLTAVMDEDGHSDEVFMEQEETRAIRTRKWLLMRRCPNAAHGFEDALYDLKNDPDEKQNLITDPKLAPVIADLSARIDAFFEEYSTDDWNLWQGGTVKSNSTRPFLWQDIWGRDWTPTY